MKVYFLLSRPKAEKPTAIKLRFSYKRNFWYGTGIQIHPKYWDGKNQRPLTGTEIPLNERRANPDLQKQLARISALLQKLETEIKDYLAECRQFEKPFNIDELRGNLNRIAKPDIIENSDDDEEIKFVSEYFSKFIHEIETGKRLTPDKNPRKYTKTTVKGYNQFYKFWQRFEESINRKVRFDQVNKNLYDQLLNYCHSQNYRHNYTGRRIKELKSLMNAAYEDGIHDNQAYKDFKALKTETVEIALTENEVQQIQSLDLSDDPPFDKARDLFLIGCYTALRFSDIRRLRPEHIVQNEAGNLIHVFTQKTGKETIIPIRPELWELLEKYKFQAPKLAAQTVNERIKIIAYKAGITGSEIVKEIIGGMTVEKAIPRYKMISTHTARRTAATLMYYAEIPIVDIMQITGHRKESTFLNYIKTGPGEAAARMRNNRFFRGNPLKRVK